MIETAGRTSIDSSALERGNGLDLLRSYAFTGVHLLALASLATGFSWPPLIAMLLAYWVRLFGITAAYHRYFAHRSFRTSRLFQFALAWLGASAGQNGPLWWVSHHRLHHRHAGWILSRRYAGYDASVVRDLGRFPELRFLDRNHMLAPLSLGLVLFGLGWWLELYAPGLGTSRWQLVGWGLFISTVLLYHTTFLVNSAAHTIGKRRYETNDDSRNNWWVALLTLGEGWHNNHHRLPSSERQGFFWWEIDVTHYGLKLLEKLGLIWNLRPPPPRAYELLGRS
jgi:stearoyl-CoA desaturase (delta-9 desaturase)